MLPPPQKKKNVCILNFLAKGPYFIVTSDNTIFAFSNFSASLMTGFKRFSLSHWLSGI